MKQWATREALCDGFGALSILRFDIDVVSFYGCENPNSTPHRSLSTCWRRIFSVGNLQKNKPQAQCLKNTYKKSHLKIALRVEKSSLKMPKTSNLASFWNLKQSNSVTRQANIKMKIGENAKNEIFWVIFKHCAKKIYLLFSNYFSERKREEVVKKGK